MIGKVYKKKPVNRVDDIVDALAVAAKVAISFFAIVVTAYAIVGAITQ